ncbi:unnamed protein product [Timema podura]|uniref:TRAM domain-containing protein n=1 Tax=Timema podura TaxID=61482 RepID=A0ABN7NVG0_TIMPD|nr:unnamed protein product [Timema podura]
MSNKSPEDMIMHVKKRTKELFELFQSYLPYQYKVGEIQKVLVTELSYDKKHYVGHNKFYEQVLVPLQAELLGKMVTVQITSSHKHCMMGEPVNEALWVSPGLSSPLPPGQVSGATNLRFKTQAMDSQVPFSLVPFTCIFVLLAVLARFIRDYQHKVDSQSEEAVHGGESVSLKMCLCILSKQLMLHYYSDPGYRSRDFWSDPLPIQIFLCSSKVWNWVKLSLYCMLLLVQNCGRSMSPTSLTSALMGLLFSQHFLHDSNSFTLGTAGLANSPNRSWHLP